MYKPTSLFYDFLSIRCTQLFSLETLSGTMSFDNQIIEKLEKDLCTSFVHTKGQVFRRFWDKKTVLK